MHASLDILHHCISYAAIDRRTTVSPGTLLGVIVQDIARLDVPLDAFDMLHKQDWA
jgi:hypothetical protein